ncbi:hypothetical protein GLOTRDRAFT_93397 [Gloeophyllum trabeum ATCC 11539]|uniref:Uncharacterized protein n=1 Tax=Gloeophyllum trabeum (strain ATCC 11539 / FP-39264 / Madison 617) TaxID=670483 RepID=S7Q8U6_GLOTA|nr:uncharacterized protein GLOTRDRAFT_93397 [Gloeophyllum trabeum ATCC 11539]EPQ55853.1 hypothetical protein GLOTRDRAFT_93397 [Gloeophyllum trabeum ATCC 11539]
MLTAALCKTTSGIKTVRDNNREDFYDKTDVRDMRALALDFLGGAQRVSPETWNISNGSVRPSHTPTLTACATHQDSAEVFYSNREVILHRTVARAHVRTILQVGDVHKQKAGPRARVLKKGNLTQPGGGGGVRLQTPWSDIAQTAKTARKSGDRTPAEPNCSILVAAWESLPSAILSFCNYGTVMRADGEQSLQRERSSYRKPPEDRVGPTKAPSAGGYTTGCEGSDDHREYARYWGARTVQCDRKARPSGALREAHAEERENGTGTR